MSSKSKITIAVDLDDVLIATNEAAARWHNRRYGTTMNLGDFLYYHWWKNPNWGIKSETFGKAIEFYQQDEYIDAPPVRDALRHLKQLKSMGFRLVIVTARSEQHRTITENALKTHFPGIFDGLEFTASIGGRGTTMTKPQMIRHLGASLLIDDSLDNALDCANVGIPVLLFGDYEWNKRVSALLSPEDHMGYDEREAVEGQGSRWWTRDEVAEASLPSLITRVVGWHDVTEAIQDRLGDPRSS